MDRETVESQGEIAIRDAHVADAEAILALVRTAVREGVFGVDEHELDASADSQRELIDEARSCPSSRMLVADHAGTVAGVAELRRQRRRRFAHSATLTLVVAPAYRRRGVGEALVRALLAWVEAHDSLERAQLAVLSTNSAAIRLYARLGFVEEGRRVGAVRTDDGRYADEILMCCRWPKRGVDRA